MMPADKDELRIALVGFDLDILELAENCGFNVEGCFDQEDKGCIPYLGNDLQGKEYDHQIVFGMQSPTVRQMLWPDYMDRATSLISAHAQISSRAAIDIGSTVHHGAVILPNATIGKAVQIHPGVLVHHESVVGDFTTLSPGAMILGRVNIGQGAFIGAGAIIRENINIADNAIIGAGAVVVKDVSQNQTVAGVPAKPM
jgi:sugar O-acyltransferase (sialic acid O-acetyltransferase NeuD family)